MNDDAMDKIKQKLSNYKLTQEQNKKVLDFYLWAYQEKIILQLPSNHTADRVISQYKDHVNELINVKDFEDNRERLESSGAEIYELHKYDIVAIPVKHVINVQNLEHLRVDKQYVDQLPAHLRINYYNIEKDYYRKSFYPQGDINVRWKTR